MTLSLFALALAADGPARCTVKWTGPAEKCAIREEYEIQATAPSEKAAEKAARKQLVHVLELEREAVRARSPAIPDLEFERCEATTKDAFVNCFPEPAMAEEKLCFVELAGAPECWNGDLLNLEEVGWRALVVGRRQMCAAVDEHLVSQNYTDVDARRAECRATCEARTTVRCP
jgi:hypothetical protein